MVTKQRNFKMEWAKIHLDTLNRDLAELVGKPENVYRITTEEDVGKGRLRIISEYVDPGGLLKIGFMAGDFVSNLRSSLDHIAWALAKIGERRPSSKTCFPVCERDSASARARIASATIGIPPLAISRIKGFQPYNLGDDYKSHHLWKLNFLWNLDKHRNMMLHSINSDTIFIVTKGVPVEETKFDDCTIVSMPLSAKDKVHFNTRPNIHILFGDEDRGVKVTIQELEDIYKFVSSEVMPELSCFLP